jgi:hypothetical protein
MTSETKNVYSLLFDGLEIIINEAEFNANRRRVLDAVFDSIFSAQEAGKLQWVRTGDELRDLTTQAIVKNFRGEEITIPVYLYVVVGEFCVRSAYLTLFTRGGEFCVNSYDTRVQKLFMELVGERLSSDPIGDRIDLRTKSKRCRILGIF